MRIKFESSTRFYEANVGDDIEDLYRAIKDGMVAMSYSKETAGQMAEELKKNDQ